MAYKDFYKVLGVEKHASQDEINAAYRKLARKYHPDISKAADAETRFKEVGAAYDVLRDPDKRKLYDRYGDDWKAVSEGRAAPDEYEKVRVDFGKDGFNAEDLGDLNSLFEQFFGAQARQQGVWGHAPSSPFAPPAAALDIEAQLDLSVEEAFRGGHHKLTLKDPTTGEPKSYRVRIPSGVRAGQRIRLAGQGRAAARSASQQAHGKRGDLYLNIALQPSANFSLQSDGDLGTTLDLSPWEAALGGSVEVWTLDGPVSVKIPAGSSSGRVIRLQGKGYPKEGGARGDLYATVRIRVPEKLSTEERKLFESLAHTSRFEPRTHH